MTPPLIALEEHYYSNAIFESIGDKFQHSLQAVPGLADQLREVGDRLFVAMDRGHISLQVISHAFTPGSPSIENCRIGNDEFARAAKRQRAPPNMAEIIWAYILQHIAKSGQPARLAAFAVFPCSNAAESAHELDRTVLSLGFVGALIDNHAIGKHFDSAEYDVLWVKACALDVPIYLHPPWPSAGMAEGFIGAYPEPVTISLGAAGWGWPGDVRLHILKLFCSNVFDRFPALKIIIGHMGETLPFMLERCYDMNTRWGGGWGPHERPFRQVWDENIWIATSGAWSLAPIKCILENTKVERIMYSVDYPFETNEKGREWFEQLEMVAYGNAQRLLKVKIGLK